MGLDKSQLKVGDMVGFQDNHNNDLYGKIIRLNQKTATIREELGFAFRNSQLATRNLFIASGQPWKSLTF